MDTYTKTSPDDIVVEASWKHISDIGFGQADFSWSNERSDGTLTPSRRAFHLRIDDEVMFKEGAFNLIIGPTGSGKTSVLMALLGEMHYMPRGEDSWMNLPRRGGVAYAAQESWVQNETIKVCANLWHCCIRSLTQHRTTSFSVHSMMKNGIRKVRGIIVY